MSGMGEVPPPPQIHHIRMGQGDLGMHMQELDFQHIARGFQSINGRLRQMQEPEFIVIQVGDNGNGAVQQIF